jgi:hypothetical protein
MRRAYTCDGTSIRQHWVLARAASTQRDSPLSSTPSTPSADPLDTRSWRSAQQVSGTGHVRLVKLVLPLGWWWVSQPGSWAR